MNRKTYRLVYSRLRGMLVAVEESAAATGKEAGQTPLSRRKSQGVIISLRQITFAALALLGTLPSLSGAQIVPGGAHGPSVIQTQNGLDQVNVRLRRSSSVPWGNAKDTAHSTCIVDRQLICQDAWIIATRPQLALNPGPAPLSL
jgi:hypothetical protein